MSRKTAIVDPILGPLSDDLLTRDYRVWQRVHGHRFSVDDMATAFVAVGLRPKATTACDLGCGLGSVLLHLAWSMPDATLVGVEAQPMSFDLLNRNISRNNLNGRVTALHGDLRTAGIVERLERLGPFDIVTGTPPYFPPDTALDAMDEQRAYARIEYRGGVEAYIQTARHLMGPTTPLVLCGDHEAEPRVVEAARAYGFMLTACLDVVPRANEPVLFTVWTLFLSPPAAPTPTVPPPRSSMTLRDAAGQPTPDAGRLRTFSGF